VNEELHKITQEFKMKTSTIEKEHKKTSKNWIE
jgi:hypothetical protein